MPIGAIGNAVRGHVNAQGTARDLDRLIRSGRATQQDLERMTEGLSRLQRQQLNYANQSYEQIRRATREMRNQNIQLAQSYTLAGQRAAVMDRVADVHREITQQLSLERLLSRALGAVWENQVSKGVRLAASVIADMPRDITEANRAVAAVSGSFNDLTNQTRTLARRYHEDFAELSQVQDSMLRNMKFLRSELDEGAAGGSEMMRNLNASLSTLLEVGIQLQDVNETMNFGAEAAQLGHVYAEVTGGLRTIMKMTEILALRLHKGPNAEITQFDHILRNKVIKDVRELFKEFKGINLSITRLSALMLTAGERAAAMGATIEEASNVSRGVGRFLGNARGRNATLKFMEGQNLSQQFGFERRTITSRDARGRQVRTQETVQQAAQRIMREHPDLYQNPGMTAQQRQQRIEAILGGTESGDVIHENALAEEFGGTTHGIQNTLRTLRSLVSGARSGQGGAPSRGVRAQLINQIGGMEGMSSMEQLQVRQLIEQGGPESLEQAAQMLQTAAERENEANDATDPVRQGQAIQRTSEGIQRIIELNNLGSQDLQRNMDRIIGNLTSMAATMLPGGIIFRMYQKYTGDQSTNPAVVAPRTQAQVNAAAEATGGSAGSAGRVTGEVDTHSGGAVTSHGVNEGRSALINFHAARQQAAREIIDNQSTAERVFRGATGITTGGSTLGNIASAASNILPLVPLARLGMHGFSSFLGSDAEQNDTAEGSQATQRAIRTQIGSIRAAYGSDVANEMQRRVDAAGGDFTRIQQAFGTLDAIINQVRGGPNGGAPTPALPANGGAPAPTAPPSAQQQQAAGRNAANSAALGSTSTGAAGMRGTINLATLGGGPTQLTANLRVEGGPQFVAANMASAQQNGLAPT